MEKSTWNLILAEISSSILSFKENTNRLKELDEALKNVRVADPAVGSGAFPLGMLNEMSVQDRIFLLTWQLI